MTEMFVLVLKRFYLGWEILDFESIRNNSKLICACSVDRSSKFIPWFYNSGILQFTAILSAANIAAVAPAGSVDDGDDAEAGGESDLEQMEGTELAGDISSSSRDATPQQDDTDMNVIPQVESKEHEESSVTPEPQVALAVRVAHTLVSLIKFFFLKKVIYGKIFLLFIWSLVIHFVHN